MAKILVEKPDRLLGEEIRFLRKHAGLSGQELAALLDDDVTPEHVSHVAPCGAQLLADSQGPGMTCPGRLFSSKIAGDPCSDGCRRFDGILYWKSLNSWNSTRTVSSTRCVPLGGPLCHRLLRAPGRACPSLGGYVAATAPGAGPPPLEGALAPRAVGVVTLPPGVCLTFRRGRPSG